MQGMILDLTNRTTPGNLQTFKPQHLAGLWEAELSWSIGVLSFLPTTLYGTLASSSWVFFSAQGNMLCTLGG